MKKWINEHILRKGITFFFRQLCLSQHFSIIHRRNYEVKQDAVAHICNLGYQEAEIGRITISGLPRQKVSGPHLNQ
jgi:hypothetical protein